MRQESNDFGTGVLKSYNKNGTSWNWKFAPYFKVQQRMFTWKKDPRANLKKEKIQKKIFKSGILVLILRELCLK